MEKDVTVRIGITLHPKDGSVIANAYATIYGLGEVVIGSGRNEYQAQLSAAKFLDANYPELSVEWEGGYRGGDTTGVRPTAGYYKEG